MSEIDILLLFSRMYVILILLLENNTNLFFYEIITKYFNLNSKSRFFAKNVNV